MATTIEEETEALMAEIKKRAMVFALDNFHVPTERDILLVINAMTVGASIAIEHQTR
jgi:hypothetical protein